MAKLTKEEMIVKLKIFQGQVLAVQDIIKILELDPAQEGSLRQWLHRLAHPPIGATRFLKSVARGHYKILKEIKPIKGFPDNQGSYFDLTFPMAHGGDCSTFGFNDLINVSPGDLIVISGVSNSAKTGLALNILAENLDKHQCTLMGNEYTTLDGILSPKFHRRMKRMSWVEWTNDNNEFKFELLPVRADFEDYIREGKVNIIDWVNLTTDFFLVGKLFEDIKSALGQGIAIAVLQKEENKELGRGAGFTRDLADVYLAVDLVNQNESVLTVGKVKDPKGMVTGRKWAFMVVDGGANFHNIREVKTCPRCSGKKTAYDKSTSEYGICPKCSGRGLVDIEEAF